MLAIVNLQRPVPYLYLGLGGRLVDIGGLHIPTLGSAAATFGAVYATFARFDRVQSRNNRRFVSRWLKGLTLPRDETWNDFFLELFTYLFGPRHLSLRCAVTSVLLSIFLGHVDFGGNRFSFAGDGCRQVRAVDATDNYTGR